MWQAVKDKIIYKLNLNLNWCQLSREKMLSVSIMFNLIHLYIHKRDAAIKFKLVSDFDAMSSECSLTFDRPLFQGARIVSLL